MVTYDNYSLRNLPSIDFGRINVWNRHEAYAQAKRADFLRTVPPYNSSVFLGFPMRGYSRMCTPTYYPSLDFCSGIRDIYSGLLIGCALGQTVGSLYCLAKNIFSKKSHKV
jgi:hypothetical protein